MRWVQATAGYVGMIVVTNFFLKMCPSYSIVESKYRRVLISSRDGYLFLVIRQ